jgi:hypothetical protein
MVATRLGVVVLGTCVLFGCSKETPPAAEEPRSASNAVSPQAAPTPADAPATPSAPLAAAAPAADPDHPPAAKFSESSFELSVAAPATSLKAGQVGAVEVRLTAKAPFHVNDKYPIKLKLQETPGLKYENLIVDKDAVKLNRPPGNPKGDVVSAVMPVSFTPDAAGKRTVAGRFAFSVCTEDKCLMEKRDLLLDVNVE